MFRRLQALELCLDRLQVECSTIAQKRHDLVIPTLLTQEATSWQLQQVRTYVHTCVAEERSKS